MNPYQWYVTIVAITACLCVAALILAYDRRRRELRALRRLLSGLPRCGMVCDGGSENRTCSCRGPANCQPDLRRFEVLRRAHERVNSDLGRASASADERPPDQNERDMNNETRRVLVSMRDRDVRVDVDAVERYRRTLLESDPRRT